MDQSKPAAGSSPSTDWMLRCESGPLAGKLFPLGERTVIGRALNCDISIPEGGLSREHAELRVESNQLLVRDLESSNGTFHNGERVAEARPGHGDTVAFDTMRFRVIGPSNDMDRTIISMAPSRVAARVAAPDTVPTNTVREAANRAAAPARPAPAVPPRPASAPSGGGVPAWVVLVGLALVVVLIVLVTV